MLLPFDQIIFTGVVVCIYFVCRCLNRDTIQRVQGVLPVTKLRVDTELHLFHVLFCLASGSLIFGVQAMLSTLVCATLMWAVHTFLCSEMASALSWIGMFGWLGYLNLTRPFGWALHISGCVMLMTIRYTSHAGDVQNNAVKTGSLIEWLGWTYFIPGFFTGPTMALQDYRRYHTYLTAPASPASQPEEDAQPEDNSDRLNIVCVDSVEIIDIEATRPPNRAFVRALWYVPFVIVGQTAFPVEGVTRFAAADGMIYRVFYAWMALWCIKCRYYVAWGLAEASFSASNASLFVWHRGRNVDVWQVELGRSTHSILKYWNMCTADWLKRYVYIPTRMWLSSTDVRAPDLMAIVVTNVVSAVWHGLSPGYYATFVGGGVCTAVGRLLYVYVEPNPKTSHPIVVSLYEVAMVLWTAVLVITFGIPFQLLSWHATWEAWKGLFFIGHVWLGAALMLVLATMVLRPTATKEEKLD